jgi:hypothetical protein
MFSEEGGFPIKEDMFDLLTFLYTTRWQELLEVSV